MAIGLLPVPGITTQSIHVRAEQRWAGIKAAVSVINSLRPGFARPEAHRDEPDGSPI